MDNLFRKKPGRKRKLENPVTRTFIFENSFDEKLTDWCVANKVSKSDFIQRAVLNFMKRNKNVGYVYLWREPLKGHCKIGKSKDPEHRLEKEFNAKLPYDFELVHKIESSDYTLTERLLHIHFDSKRARGEWFALEEEDIKMFVHGPRPKRIEDSIDGIESLDDEIEGEEVEVS